MSSKQQSFYFKREYVNIKNTFLSIDHFFFPCKSHTKREARCSWFHWVGSWDILTDFFSKYACFLFPAQIFPFTNTWSVVAVQFPRFSWSVVAVGKNGCRPCRGGRGRAALCFRWRWANLKPDTSSFAVCFKEAYLDFLLIDIFSIKCSIFTGRRKVPGKWTEIIPEGHPGSGIWMCFGEISLRLRMFCCHQYSLWFGITRKTTDQKSLCVSRYCGKRYTPLLLADPNLGMPSRGKTDDTFYEHIWTHPFIMIFKVIHLFKSNLNTTCFHFDVFLYKPRKNNRGIWRSCAAGRMSSPQCSGCWRVGRTRPIHGARKKRCARSWQKSTIVFFFF